MIERAWVILAAALLAVAGHSKGAPSVGCGFVFLNACRQADSLAMQSAPWSVTVLGACATAERCLIDCVAHQALVWSRRV